MFGKINVTLKILLETKSTTLYIKGFEKKKLYLFFHFYFPVNFLYFIRQSHDCCFKDENSPDMKLFEPVEKKLFCHSCKRLLSRKNFEANVRIKKLSHCQGRNFFVQIFTIIFAIIL